MEKKEIESFVKKLINVIWENQELDKLDRFYTQDLVGLYNKTEVTFEDLKNKIKVFHEHVKHLQIDILHLIIENNKFTLHANQNFTTQEGKEVSIPSLLFAHLKEGKICKYWLKTRMPLDFD